MKKKHEKSESSKNQYVDSIKKSFEGFDKKELQFLKSKDEEHDVMNILIKNS